MIKEDIRTEKAEVAGQQGSSPSKEGNMDCPKSAISQLPSLQRASAAYWQTDEPIMPSSISAQPLTVYIMCNQLLLHICKVRNNAFKYLGLVEEAQIKVTSESKAIKCTIFVSQSSCGLLSDATDECLPWELAVKTLPSKKQRCTSYTREHRSTFSVALLS